MKDWIMELCPEIADWQVDIIAEEIQKRVLDEREACAKLVDDNADWCDEDGILKLTLRSNANAIRARGQG